MPTFAGTLLQEPIDFISRFSERDIIQMGDDPESPQIKRVAFVELTPEEKAIIVASVNALVASAEAEIGMYARAGGYVFPFTQREQPMIELATLGVLLRHRARRRIKIDDADRDAYAARLAELRSGKIQLQSDRDGAVTPEDTAVVGMWAEDRVFSRTSLKGF